MVKNDVSYKTAQGNKTVGAKAAQKKDTSARKAALLLGTAAVYFIFICICITEPPLFCAVFFLSAAFHEVGHFAAARLCKVKGRMMATPSGFRVRTKTGLSYGKEAFIYVAGPAANIILFIAAFFLLRAGWRGDAIILAAALNAGLAIFNLLPVSGFDGGGILRCVLSRFLNPAAAFRVCLAVSLIIAWAFFSACTFLFLRYGCALYPLFVSVWMLAGILSEDIRG